MRHARNLHRPDHPPEVVVIGLHNIDAIVGEEPAKPIETVVLLAIGDRYRERVGDLFDRNCLPPPDRDRQAC
jgi:hypothetical protein